MTYTFNGISIINTETHEEYDTHILDDMETLTEHLNNLNTIKKAITINKSHYRQSQHEPMLLPSTRDDYKIKYETLIELEEKAERLRQMRDTI